MIFPAIKQTIKSLLLNKVRSFLTMLGIIVGVAAVIIIMSIGSGAQSLILGQIESFGADTVSVLPGKADDDKPPASAMGIVITTLNYEDYLALLNKKNIPNVSSVVAYSNSAADLSYSGISYSTSVSGTTHAYIDVEGGEIVVGRFFNKDEEKNLSKVVVLGNTVKNELFGEKSAVGKKIKIKKHLFEVIGTMAERGKVAFQDYDDKVFIPLKTEQKLLSGVSHLGLIRLKLANEDEIARSIEDIVITLRQEHNIKNQTGSDDDFSIRSAAQAIDVIKTITDSLKYFLAAMAALSLLVGGIGIMNIMLVNVNEKTKEIGLRKALGATNKDIIFQFLLETVTITVIGGILGIIGGVFVSYIVSLVMVFLNYSWKFEILTESILAGIFVSTVIGLIFGLYPAKKASNLEPIEALRYE